MSHVGTDSAGFGSLQAGLCIILTQNPRPLDRGATEAVPSRLSGRDCGARAYWAEAYVVGVAWCHALIIAGMWESVCRAGAGTAGAVGSPPTKSMTRNNAARQLASPNRKGSRDDFQEAPRPTSGRSSAATRLGTGAQTPRAD